MKIEQIIKDEYIHARNNDDHARNATKKIEEELKKFWTDIAIYAIKCGLQGEEYMRFAEYGAMLLGLRIHDDYERLKELTNNN